MKGRDHVIDSRSKERERTVFTSFLSEAQCSATKLGAAITNIQTDISSTEADINKVETAKLATRNSIDCFIYNETRAELFDHYEGKFITKSKQLSFI